MIYRKPWWVDKLYQLHRKTKEKEVVESRKLTDNTKYRDNLCSASYRRFVISKSV